MLTGLQSSTNGVPVGAERLAVLRANALTVVRIEAGPDPRAAAQEVLDAGLRPLVICATVDQARQLPAYVDAEWGNEPDIRGNGWTVERYVREGTEFLVVALDRGLRPWVGAVSNLNDRGFNFLRQLPWSQIPASVGCSVHRYPEVSGPEDGHDGRTRDEEVAELKAIVGERPLAVTEVGYNAVDFSHDQIIAGYVFERAFWTRHGIAFCVAYQITDGPGASRLDRYGFHTVDGVWKRDIVAAWTGHPFIEPGTAEPEPEPIERTYDIPVDITDGPVSISGRLTVRVRAAVVEPEPEPEPEPVRDLTMVVSDIAGRPVIGATVTPLGDHLFDPNPRTADGSGFVHVPVYGATSFRIEASGFEPLETRLEPGEFWAVTLTRQASTARARRGVPRVDGNTLVDADGRWFAEAASLFCGVALVDRYQDRAEANGAYLRDRGRDSVRVLGVLGGDTFPAPNGQHVDPWKHLIADPRDPAWPNQVAATTDYFYDRFGLRVGWTIFGGTAFAPTLEDQERVVRMWLATTGGRLHKIGWVEVANEMWQNGFAGSEGIARARHLADLLASGLPKDFPVAISTPQATAADDDPREEIRQMFEGSAANLFTPHFSRDITKVDGPWRAVRQPWEWAPVHSLLAALNNEPIGLGSSVANARMAAFRLPVAARAAFDPGSVPRIVAQWLTTRIARMTGYIFHCDAGIWSDLIADEFKGQHGRNRFIQDQPGADEALTAMQRLRAVLPAIDVHTWRKTRHGFDDHPFARSFERVGDGFSQIWPDQITSHGVVRAYASLRAKQFVCLLSGIRDRIELRWDAPMNARLYQCDTGLEVATITPGQRARTVPQTMDTDVLIVGEFE